MLKNRKVWIVAIVLVVIAAVFLFNNKSDSSDSNNTLRVAIMGEPASLDPNFTTGTWENIILTDLFSGLTAKNAKGETVPESAESWKVSPDGTVYTFYLRDNKWSDGIPVTAADFEFAYKRILNPETASSYASMLYVIKGAKDYNTGKAGVEGLGVKAIDDKTLQITLEHPTSYFISMLHHYTFSPLPKHAVEKYGKEWSKPGNMVSNGAYKLVEWKPQSYVKAARNEFYYNNANTKIDNVVYYTQEDRAAILKRFRSNEIDIADDFASDQYEWIAANLPGQYDVSPYMGIYYFAINMKDKIMSNPKVREAINLAIDREFITSKVLKSGEIPATSFVPIGVKNYKPAEFSFKNMSKEERIAKAKQLLLDAGYNEQNPLSVEISYNTSENHKKVSIAVANMLKDIGINYTLTNKEVAVHYKDMQNGNFQIGRAGWIADYDDPASFLYIGETGVGNNYAKFSSKQYDDDFAKAKTLSSEAARNEFYKAAERILLDSAAYIPIYYYVSHNLVSNRIEGFIPNVSNTHPAKYISFKEVK
ncbi:MAG: peptide ABC transporter substrate-binding protein [Alphaproteobacteria bacterium]|nr:peptide ABC transporter substrate-binding protein [Alphaproteobacteria bacterium]